MKSLINYPFLKENLKRFWAIAVLSLLAYVLTIIVPLYSTFSSPDPMYSASVLINIIGMKHLSVPILSVVIPLVSVLSMFSYLFQPKSTATIHSFPISKNQLFFTNIATGFILIIIPLLILCIFLLTPITWNIDAVRNNSMLSIPVELFPKGIESGAVVNTLPVVISFFLRSLLMFAFFYSIYLLAAMVSGNPIICVLICGILPFIPCSFFVLQEAVNSFYMLGYEGYNSSDQLMKMFVFTNPVALLSVFNFSTATEVPKLVAQNLLPYYISYILITIALLSIAFWCNRTRQQERAGDSVVFIAVKNILIFVLSAFGMIFMGAFFISAFQFTMSIYLGFFVGFIIACFISYMIAEKTFNVLYKARDILKLGALMCGILVVIASVSWLDVFGTQRYAPKPEEIEGIYLNAPYTMRTNASNSHYGNTPKPDHRLNFLIHDESIIANALEAHKQIIANRRDLRNTFLQNLTGANREQEVHRQSFIYLLKNGKYVYRTYILPEEFKERIGLTDLIMTDTVILSRFPTLKSPNNLYSLNIRFEHYNSDGSYETSSEAISVKGSANITSLLAEITKDLLITEKESIKFSKKTEMEQERFSIDCFTEIKINDKIMTGDYFNLATFGTTKAWLEEHNLLTDEIRNYIKMKL